MTDDVLECSHGISWWADCLRCGRIIVHAAAAPSTPAPPPQSAGDDIQPPQPKPSHYHRHPGGSYSPCNCGGLVPSADPETGTANPLLNTSNDSAACLAAAREWLLGVENADVLGAHGRGHDPSRWWWVFDGAVALLAGYAQYLQKTTVAAAESVTAAPPHVHHGIPFIGPDGMATAPPAESVTAARPQAGASAKEWCNANEELVERVHAALLATTADPQLLYELLEAYAQQLLAQRDLELKCARISARANNKDRERAAAALAQREAEIARLDGMYREQMRLKDEYKDNFREAEARVSVLSEALDAHRRFICLFREFAPNCGQLLDGWHADGTAWSEWDEEVRNALTILSTVADATLAAAPPPPPAAPQESK